MACDSGRNRCEAGFGNRPCRKRACPICGLHWAKDWRQVMFRALQAEPGPVVMLTPTPFACAAATTVSR